MEKKFNKYYKTKPNVFDNINNYDNYNINVLCGEPNREVLEIHFIDCNNERVVLTTIE